MLFDRDLNNWEIDILDNTRTASIHLLHELPHPIIDYVVIFLLLYVLPKAVLSVQQFRVINAPEFPLTNIFQMPSIQLRPLLLNKVHYGAFYS